jgi:hypothetical protein
MFEVSSMSTKVRSLRKLGGKAKRVGAIGARKSMLEPKEAVPRSKSVKPERPDP